MRWMHVVAGLMGLVSGAIALYALKGAELHRRSGLIFVYAMLFLSSSGVVLAALKLQRMNLIVGVLTFYLVITGLLTVRRRVEGFPWLDLGAMLVGSAAGIASIAFGFDILSSPTGKIDGMPPAAAFVFGAVALLAVLGDIRMMLGGGLRGAPRIARHLWRMCTGLFIAAGSFFLGQTARIFPKALRQSGVLAIPVLVVLFVMFYWLARLRFTQWQRRVPDIIPGHGGSVAASIA